MASKYFLPIEELKSLSHFFMIALLMPYNTPVFLADFAPTRRRSMLEVQPGVLAGCNSDGDHPTRAGM